MRLLFVMFISMTRIYLHFMLEMSCDCFADEAAFRNLVLWIEDQKIRHYAVEDRTALRNISSTDWLKTYEQVSPKKVLQFQILFSEELSSSFLLWGIDIYGDLSFSCEFCFYLLSVKCILQNASVCLSMSLNECLSHRNYVCLSVCHTGGSVKNAAR